MREVELEELSGCHSGRDLGARARRNRGRVGDRRPIAPAVPVVEDLELQLEIHPWRRRSAIQLRVALAEESLRNNPMNGLKRQR